jgi:lipid-binding SYLF domain-containing protein
MAAMLAPITNWKMKAEVLTYSGARGFASVDLTGFSITQDKDERESSMGNMAPFEDILAGRVPATSNSESFLATVKKYTTQPRQAGE